MGGEGEWRGWEVKGGGREGRKGREGVGGEGEWRGWEVKGGGREG